MASLEVLLGVAAAVVLLGVLAVRVSVRLGLPSLLLYLGIGILLGESVLGIQFSDAGSPRRSGSAALVLILAEGGLTTRWAAVRPALRRGHRAVDGGGRREHRRRRRRAAPAAGPGLAHRVPVGRGAVVDRRRRGVQRAARGGGEPAAARRAGAGVGHERRAGRARRRPARLRRPDHLADPAAGGLRARRGRGRSASRSGRAGAWALRRAALPVDRPVPARRDRRLRARLLGRAARARLRAAGDLRRRAGARQLQPAAPRRRAARSPRGLGWLAQIGLFVLLGLYASPPRLVDARRPRADRRGGAGGGRAPAVGGRGGRAVPGAVARAGVPVLVGAARRGADRAGADRAAPRGRRTAQRWSTSCSCWSWCSPCCRAPRCRSWPARLGVVGGREPQEIEVDAAPLDELGADLLQVRVPVGSRLRGVYLRELRLPHGATVSLVVRDEEAFTPTGRDPAARARPAAGRHHGRGARGRPSERIRAVDRARPAGPLARRSPAATVRDDGRCECRRRPPGRAAMTRSRRGPQGPAARA